MPAVSARRVLWAEDSAADRRLITLACQDLAAPPRIAFARDGAALLEALRRPPLPDLVVLDLNMPGLHGTEVLHCIRDEPATRSLPVIVFTSTQSLDEVAACYRLRVDAIVHKPTNLDGFVNAVRRLLAQPRLTMPA